MKVWIENSSQPIDKLNGKSLFCRRLGDQLKTMGVTIVDGESPADISINVIRLKHHRSKVKILRIDGVWHDTAKNFIQKNKAISDSVKRADGIIFQSEFARNMGEKYLVKAKCPTTVIFNGSDPRIYNNASSVEFDKKYIFVAISKWRPHKRLKDIIESFILANIDNSRLLILGNTEKCGMTRSEFEGYVNRDDIDYLGSLPQSMLIPVIKGVAASIHLCWFDACPNSVVEAICAGVPVITNNVGGTWEIVAPSGGYVCDIDSPYDLNPVDLYHPPKIDRNKVAEAMRKCVSNRPKITCEHVDIRNVARQYLDFMESLL